MALIGPCIVAAPVVGVVAILALPLWPVAIVVVGIVRLPVWILARLSPSSRWATRFDQRLGSAFKLVLRPWSWFDPPSKD